jgi:hypothetical protein
VYVPLPAWRKHARRPSGLDLVALLRKELVDNPSLVAGFSLNPSADLFVSAAAA